MLVLTLHQQGAKSNQRYCASCPAELARISKVRFCHYTGKLYCRNCHTKDRSVIPARVVHLWDFREYGVCAFAKRHIHVNAAKPLVDLSSRMRLYSMRAAVADGLGRVLRLRSSLYAMAELVHTCRSEAALLQLLGRRGYVLASPHVYSLADLAQVRAGGGRAGPFERWLRDAHMQLATHIGSTCPSCKGKGYFCEICRSPQLVFAFQQDLVARCVCGALNHKACVASGAQCPKCERIRRVRGQG